jgi:hypothetical protein
LRKILLITLVVIGVAVLVVLGWSLYTFATMQSDRDVATGVNIFADWLEITPQPPLKATKQVQHLIILVDGYKRSIDDTRNRLPLPDGTMADPEVELVDEGGNTYGLQPSLLVSGGVGYTGDYAPHSSLPQNKSFTKVRIRSDNPFRAAKIIWQNQNLL